MDLSLDGSEPEKRSARVPRCLGANGEGAESEQAPGAGRCDGLFEYLLLRAISLTLRNPQRLSGASNPSDAFQLAESSAIRSQIDRRDFETLRESSGIKLQCHCYVCPVCGSSAQRFT